MESTPPTVLIVDDHAMVREGVRRALVTSGIDVVAEATTHPEAISLIFALRPRVVLLDLIMPDSNVLAVLEAARTTNHSKVLVLTGLHDERRAAQLMRAGATGYVLKVSSFSVLVGAIHRVASGLLALDPALEHSVLYDMARYPSTLSPRETEVMGLIGTGMTNDAIATRLGITKQTVRAHLGSIVAKLELTSRTDAMLHALREGYTSLDEIPRSPRPR